jgi:hypothetical protein
MVIGGGHQEPAEIPARDVAMANARPLSGSAITCVIADTMRTDCGRPT